MKPTLIITKAPLKTYLQLERGQVSVLSFWWQDSIYWPSESAHSVPPIKYGINIC